MFKKMGILLFGFIILFTLTACPDQEKTEQQENTEKIPNTMQKASDELEQIITLLGGPLFNGRDNIEQIKNEQIQMLSETMQKSSLGTQNEEQSQPDSGTEKEEQQQEGSQSEKQESGQKEKQEGEQDQQKEQGSQDGEQGQQKEQSGQEGEQKEKSSDGSEKEKQGEDGKSEQGESKEEEPQSQEGGGEQGKKEETQKENSGEKQDTQRPETSQDNKTFQHEDSLFGIPQWHGDNWKMVKILTDGMHFTWNNLQPELVKKGVSQNQTENFNKALEALSQNVKTKNIKESQNAAFQLSQALSEFYSYYKTEIPPELQRITSGVTGIHFSVTQNNWPQAQELANQLQQEFTKLKASIDDNQSHIFQMLELSLNDLCSAVQDQDSVLVMIRTNLVNANVNELDVKLSQKQE